MASGLNKSLNSPSLLQCVWAAVKVIQDFLLKNAPISLQYINPGEAFYQPFFLLELSVDEVCRLFRFFVHYTKEQNIQPAFSAC